ncbi:MAG: GMC family oxidoreductase [Polyangiaceae bacterium]|nr:GMC family oxidoreductase [Polyangiaceae bacterium]
MQLESQAPRSPNPLPLADPPPRPEPDAPRLPGRARRIALALAEAALPARGGLVGGSEQSVLRLERLAERLGSDFARGLRAGLLALDASTVLTRGGRFSELPVEQRAAALQAWVNSEQKEVRWMVRALLTPIKAAHFDDAQVFAEVGCRPRERPARAEPARWWSRVTDGRTVEHDLELECEVVVVGTGAGGAAMAYELARRGRAVLMLEAGDFHRRDAFDGRSSNAYARMYLGRGTTFALGNVATPVWAGRAVGGTTTINSGTCYRAPARTLDRWKDRYGLGMLSRSALDPYYDRVEELLQVEPARAQFLGGSARVVARGAERLGLSHGPLRRNAPDCDGQGVCCFGCPTGAKQSADVSLVPRALSFGAELVTAADVRRVTVRGGRARGVTGFLRSGRRLTVKADAVVVAGGALMTPLLLERSGACRSSGWLGKNLSVHPATKVFALFDEDIDMSRGIPQSYFVDALHEEGILCEGASVPLDVASLGVPWAGDALMELMESYPQLASFGVMVQDTSRGRVRPGPRGLPLITYDMNENDTQRLQRGVALITELFLKAGARRVFPFVHGCMEVVDEAGLSALKSLRARPGDIEVTAYHPLGTSRIGTDPSRSCVGPDHEAHDTEGLYVVDGSAVPSSLGVNPQLTIMALALRAAEILDGRLDRPRSGADATPEWVVRFEETMRGTFRLAHEEDERPIEFTLRVRSVEVSGMLANPTMVVDGSIRAAGLATDAPLTGTLAADVLVGRRIPYDLAFQGDDGNRYRFVGEKRPTLLRPLHSMTYLPGRIVDEAGKEIAVATLWFEVSSEWLRFARSFRLVQEELDQ